MSSESARFWRQTLLGLALSWPVRLAAEMRQDVAYAYRLWGKRPVFALFIVVTLALGIGATTGVFAVVNAILVRPLPFAQPERLVAIDGFRSEPIAGNAARFHDWREQSRRFFEDSVVYMLRDEANVGGPAGPVRAMVVNVTSNFFTMLGVRPHIGAAFRAGDPPRGEAAVIGYDLWQRTFGGDPRVVGRTVTVNGRPLTVAGVARPGFDYPDGAQVWACALFTWPWPDGSFRMVTVGRLRPGGTLARAQADFSAYVKRGRVESNWTARLVPLQAQMAGRFGRASIVLLGAVGFVLLIACANVANLLVTRTTERRRELRIRAAIGAGRGRMFRQLLTESLLLSAAAGLASLAVAYWTTRILQAIAPPALPSQSYAVTDWRVLALTGLLSVGTAPLFAVLPGVRHTGIRVADGTLRTGAGQRRRGFRHVLVATQVGLCLVLLTGAFVMVSTLRELLLTDYGLRTDGIVTMSVSLEGMPAYDRRAARRYYANAVERLRTAPGVVSAAGINFLPMVQYTHYATNFTLNWRIPPADEYREALCTLVTPGYFDTMGIRLLAGRDFTGGDDDTTRAVVIVSEEFAEGFRAPEDLLGRTLEHEPSSPSSPTIVGVARSVKYKGPGVAVFPQVYQPVVQAHWPYLTFALATRGPSDRVAAAAREALAAVDRQVPIYGISTLEERLAALVAEPRFYTFAVASLGGLALLLAVLGVYALVSYGVAQRAHEIGVRLALGATPRDVRRHLLGGALVPVIAGAAAGSVGTLAARRLTAALIHGAAPIDWTQAAAACVALAAAAIFAAWRATMPVRRMNVLDVLRFDSE
jgi:putative ABC transport system permease protein